jgi:FAD-linked sulfhydryl oxidase
MRVIIILLLLVSVQGIFEPICVCACEDLDRDKLGQSTWYLLHEIVRHVPPPNKHFEPFLRALSHLYPCAECRTHIGDYLLDNNVTMSKQWMCDFHNEVNVRLGKPKFDCGTV